MTIERGRDARDFVLVAFGGNGPLFAAEMARSLAIGTVLVPPAPGVFSAVGLLEAESEHHLVRSVLRPLSAETADGVAAALGALEREAEALLRTEGYREAVATDRGVDLKYEGQSFELTIPVGGLARGHRRGRAGGGLRPGARADHRPRGGRRSDPGREPARHRAAGPPGAPRGAPRERAGGPGGGTRRAYFPGGSTGRS